MTRSTPSRVLALALLGLTAAACAPTLATRGNMTDPDAVAAIQTGATTREPWSGTARRWTWVESIPDHAWSSK